MRRVSRRTPALENCFQTLVPSGKAQSSMLLVSICAPSGKSSQRCFSLPSLQSEKRDAERKLARRDVCIETRLRQVRGEQLGSRLIDFIADPVSLTARAEERDEDQRASKGW